RPSRRRFWERRGFDSSPCSSFSGAFGYDYFGRTQQLVADRVTFLRLFQNRVFLHAVDVLRTDGLGDCGVEGFALELDGLHRSHREDVLELPQRILQSVAQRFGVLAVIAEGSL